MKRIALILLSAVYLLSSSGIAANSYYCCGKLQLTTITESHNTPSGCKKNDKMKDCWKTKKQYFKVKDQHISITPFSLSHPTIAFIPSLTIADHCNLTGLLYAKIVYKGNAPPGHPDIPVYALNCTYRI